MKRITTLVVAALIALIVPFNAHALDIGEAKQRGLVGETDSGYIAAVSSPSGEVQKLVASINAQRKQVYQDLAARNNVPLSEVEKLAAEKAIAKTPAGQRVRVGGEWRVK